MKFKFDIDSEIVFKAPSCFIYKGQRWEFIIKAISSKALLVADQMRSHGFTVEMINDETYAAKLVKH